MPSPFELAYTVLNTEQKQAVDTIDGPVMVIAGPGTGKTQILTLRIAHILQSIDINPRNILALTFTEAATTTMRKRLIDLIGTTGYNVRIQTFHGFCQEVITQYPEYFPFGTDPIAASDLQTHAIMEKLLDDPKLISLRTPGSKYHYLKKILSAINTLKSEGITPPQFKELVQAEKELFDQEGDSLSKSARTKKSSEIAKQEELSTLYTLYQKELRTQGYIDFSDMIMHTVQALRTSETLRTLLQENLQYILVDEYQDTNGAQNTVVDLLASYWGESANVFVVGDPHQTIFRFQGASFENTIGFLTRYPKAQVITLQTGYRCPPSVYESAHSLISHNTSSKQLLTALSVHNPAVQKLVDGISHTLVSTKSAPKPMLSLAKLPSTTDELSWVASEIQNKITGGTEPKGIAVLVKTNEQATLVSTVFSKHDITHHVDRTTDALKTTLGQQLLTLFRSLMALSTNQESSYIYTTLSSPWMKLPPVAVMSLTRAFSKQKKEQSFLSFILSGWTVVQQSTITQVTKEEYEHIVDKLEKLLELSQLSFSFAPPNWIAQVYDELGVTNWVESQSEIAENLSVLTAFYQFAVSNYAANHTITTQKIVELFSTMEDQKLPLSISPLHSIQSSVTISTVHKAKGQEWETVFIPYVQDGVWGGERQRSGITLPQGLIATQTNDEIQEDERRLLYVALTRAKQHVILSYAATLAESGKNVDTLPSQFLLEIPQHLLTVLDTSNHDQIHSRLQNLQPIHSHSFGQPEREWVQAIIDGMSLSVSSLNTYLRDPHEFFTQHILRVPRAVESHLAFGNAIHGALEQHYKTYRTKNNTHPDEGLAFSTFVEKLKKETLSPSDFESRMTQGQIVLREYLEEKRSQFPQVLATEEGFGWKRGPVFLNDIKLSGKVDRMDVLDESSRVLHIIDYKTGKQKSVNTIEGKVGTSEMSKRERNLPEPIRGSMKRQLLFYKLLLAKDPLYKDWTIGKATFDFVQNDGGKFVERTFELRNEDMKLLEELIKDVMNEIRTLQFLENN